MRRLVHRNQPTSQRTRWRPVLEGLEIRQLLAGDFVQTNLVSDIPGLAQVTDPNLQNPWGIAASATSDFWISDNASGVSTLYDGQGQPASLVVTIPPPMSLPADTLGTPTGTVFNSTSDFVVSANGNSGPALFLFATEDGVIAGWNPNVDPTHAILAVDNPDPVNGAVYKGLTSGTDAAGDNLLYAANFRAGTVDVFDTNFHLVHLAGSFQDPNLPEGYAPFNVRSIDGKLFVAYAKQDAAKHDDMAGPGNGFIDVYTMDGDLVQRLVSQGPLNSPFGLVMAPADFGSLSNDLLVGNFGDGHINAFDPVSGRFIGKLDISPGHPFQEDGLWALRFGNGGAAGATNTLFFTAGINEEQDGLFGSLQAVPKLAANAPIVANLGNAPQQTFSTVPANGDQNPYGVAFVPQGIRQGGVLQPGDILVSNFNSSDNVQGTGTTIVRITPDGQQSVFFQGDAGLGLTTALGVLKSGFVIVGNVPTNDDGTVGQGSLLILDSNGNLVTQVTDSALLNGPWDMAINDQGNRAQVFVSNVLSGTVTRLDLRIPKGGIPMVESETQIASGYAHFPDPNALVIGPTGLAFDPQRDLLYVASTGDNAIYAIPNAAVTQRDHGLGRLVVQDDAHLHGPLGLALAPNGDLIAANGDAVNPDDNNSNELVEFTPKGQFVGQFQLDNGPAGAPFGIAVSSANGEIRFAAVDDDTNTLTVWTFKQHGSTGPERPESPSSGDHGQQEAVDEVFRSVAAALAGMHHHGIDDLFLSIE
jgi:uncharacterized protein (TIGR03118 family)